MKNKSEFIKAFTHDSRQNYWEQLKHTFDFVDEVMFGNYEPSNHGCEYELSMRWISLQNEIVPQLKIFNEAFMCFSEHKELFDELERLCDVNFTPEDFCRLLIKFGYKDFSDKKLED